MSRIAHLHSVQIRSQSNPHADLPQGIQMFAQLIVDGTIVQQTAPVDSENSQSHPSWNVKFECKVPPQVLIFRVAIMRKTERAIRLLGSTEIAQGEALSSGEQQKPLHVQMLKVNLDAHRQLVVAGMIFITFKLAL
ncbi:hypothetical protein MVEN_01735300 [Mycena venus]|uniref:C2 domain-containing protein n=1 Tax=Mycena venus TaxID=2733690 RepID=A0A8H6XK29_9AGAR|nr:hypothetical protein MVEN_01735300 [Mycena venus]